MLNPRNNLRADLKPRKYIKKIFSKAETKTCEKLELKKDFLKKNQLVQNKREEFFFVSLFLVFFLRLSPSLTQKKSAQLAGGTGTG